MFIKIFIIFALLSIVFSKRNQIEPGDDAKPAIEHSLVDKVNSMKTSWKATVSKKFQYATKADVKRLVS